jgi:hypothetical protein
LARALKTRAFFFSEKVMPLPLALQKLWNGTLRTERHLCITEEGIVLGKTVLAPFKDGHLVVDEERVLALLSVAYGEFIPASVVKSFYPAVRCYRQGDKAMAHTHLALTGLHVVDLEKAHRLFVGEWAINNGVTAKQLLKMAGLDKFNPNHLGPGPGGGQFTTSQQDGTSNGLPPGSGTPMRSELVPATSLPQGTQVAQEIMLRQVIPILAMI